MNKFTKAMVGMVVTVGLLSVPLAHTAAASDPAVTPAGSTSDQRIAQRKAERAIVLSDVDQKRLVSTCKGAQNKILAIQSNAPTTLGNYNKTYAQINAKTLVTIGELKLANQDSFELEKEQVNFKQAADMFQQTSSSYTQALDDAAIINCQADPVGFKALLETARIYYANLSTQANANRDYIVNTVKPTLVNYTTGLQAKSVTDGNSN